MTHSTDLLQRLFGKAALTDVDTRQLDEMEREYPYFAHAHWLAAAKKKGTDQGQQALYHASAYALHPLRLKQYLPGRDLDMPEATPAVTKDQPLPTATETASADPKETPEHRATEPLPPAPLSPDTGSGDAALEIKKPHDGQRTPAPPIIQPLFTQDYFAYTGVKLPDHVENDKPPTMEQLHSFTDWLRAMKRPRGTTDPDIRQDEGAMAARDESEDAGIKKSADESIRTEAEVLTESMGEVRAGKGQIPRAIAIYEKLSLSNPEKSAYFAQKIEALKHK